MYSCLSCLTQHIEHSRQDHGRSFEYPICRHEFQSLTSDQIANRFPQKIIHKRIQSSKLME